MNIAELSISKKTITLVLTGLLLVGGFVAYGNLPRLEDPEFTIKTPSSSLPTQARPPRKSKRKSPT